MAERLHGKVAVVTRAGPGIGLATTERFAAEGAAVVVNDVDADAAEEVVERTRDKSFHNMDGDLWSAVLEANLTTARNAALAFVDVVRPQARRVPKRADFPGRAVP